jgi:hypothetical protein
VDRSCGLGDGGGEQVEGGPDGWGCGRTAEAIEADDGVEVDEATTLVLGHLGERNAHLFGERSVCHSG